MVGDADLHLLAGEFPVIVLVERCDGEDEVNRQENIQCDEYVSLTDVHPSLSFSSLVSLLFPISTVRSGAPHCPGRLLRG